MAGLNSIQFGGRLASAPIVRSLADGRLVANMLILNSRTVNFGQPNERQFTDRMQAVAFDSPNEGSFQLATWCAENLHTGDEITAVGRIQSGEYQKNGEIVHTTEVIATFVHLHTSEPERERLAANREERYAIEAKEAEEQKTEEERTAAVVTA